jgi:DDE superfamily endonuclease
MEDVLDLYVEAEDPKRPRVCFDESPYQLIRETHQVIPAQPRQIERHDFEYQREGNCNLFMFACPERGWRHVKVTERRTILDVAHCLKDLVDVHFRDAEVIRLVMDQLNTHRLAVLYEVFDPSEARRIARKLEVHHTPKHGSWLDMAEIELAVLNGQCLDRRLPDIATVRAEVAAWERRRNEAKATIDWRFTAPDARDKLDRVYPT